MYARPYSIDEIVRYHQNNGSLQYMVSESENYARIGKNEQQEYSGQHKKPAIYSDNYKANENKPSKTYYFTPKMFLKPIRPLTQFVSAADQIKELMEETFFALFNKKFPKNISIHVCSKEELRQVHAQFGPWDEGIQGFAINNKNLKQIFVKNDHLDALMLTIGHEIGHVYTRSLGNSHDEEAKAFSFAAEWASAIRKHDIGNLKSSIRENLDFKPARNGLHDLAFFFVKSLMNNGLKPMQIHWDLVKGYKSMFGFYC